MFLHYFFPSSYKAESRTLNYRTVASFNYKLIFTGRNINEKYKFFFFFIDSEIKVIIFSKCE